MKFPDKYKVLKINEFKQGRYKIIPIRYKDQVAIMQWRNEQIYHLRQVKPLTSDEQRSYFKDVVSKLFEQEYPDQLLFSYLRSDECIGYGGLVHINWIDRHAEISFIMKTDLERYEFEKHWRIYLDLLERVAFEELKFHKLFTYAFDFRPQLYKAIASKGYVQEAVLKDHCYYDGMFIDVIIHSKINKSINIREMEVGDEQITYKWANDPVTRENSFNQGLIVFEDHKKWFDSKIKDETAYYMICEFEGTPVGLMRFDFDISQNAYIIGITIDEDFRGQKLARPFLKKSCKRLLETLDTDIIAYIKEENISSRKAFESAGFSLLSKVEINGIPSFKYIYSVHV